MDACSSNCGFCGRCTHGSGAIQRTCRQCGADVWFSRDEEYVVQAYCDDCIRQTANRDARSPLSDHVFETAVEMARVRR